MSWMNFFAKKRSATTDPITLGAPAKGSFVPMQDIPDDIFSAGILGTCCGIDPQEGVVYAPLDGKIIQLADTLHAIGIECKGNVEILLHVGIDTVDMGGDGFKSLVSIGDMVTRGQQLLVMDLDKIRQADHPATVITVITNTDEFSSINEIASGKLRPNSPMMQLRR